jgi:carboxymethylenebutenolidase
MTPDVIVMIDYLTGQSASFILEVAMQRILLTAAVVAFATTSAPAQDWAKARLEKSPRHLEFVKVKHGNREVNCFIAFPEVKDKATAVVVIHEIFGLSDWVRSLTDQLAEAGYIAIAPDLLTGMAPDGGGTDKLGSGDSARKAIQSLKPDQITADLNAVTDYVVKLPACNGKVAACGFCWGGGQVFRFATNNKQIKAAYVFYGGGPDKEEELKRINCPVYGFYGGNDMRVNATIPKSTEMMKKLNKTYEPITYESGRHGFMRAGDDPNGDDGNKQARDEAWKRWKELLKKV